MLKEEGDYLALSIVVPRRKTTAKLRENPAFSDFRAFLLLLRARSNNYFVSLGYVLRSHFDFRVELLHLLDLLAFIPACLPGLLFFASELAKFREQLALDLKIQ